MLVAHELPPHNENPLHFSGNEETRPMQGLMQDWPLRVTTIIDHAARFHGDREIVTRSIEGPITRTTYGQVHLRARGA